MVLGAVTIEMASQVIAAGMSRGYWVPILKELSVSNRNVYTSHSKKML